MIYISCIKQGKRYKEIEFNGHAGFDIKGKDIVCAAISVLFINTMNSIESFTEDTVEISNKSNKIRVKIPNDYSKETQVLLDSMILGMTEIKKEYSDYISLELKEE